MVLNHPTHASARRADDLRVAIELRSNVSNYRPFDMEYFLRDLRTFLKGAAAIAIPAALYREGLPTPRWIPMPSTTSHSTKAPRLTQPSIPETWPI